MSADRTTKTAALLIIGNEILSGRTQDANLAFIARELGEIGIRMAEVRIVPDIEAAIVDAVNALRARYSYVFTTGGIGPTHDDITSASIAKAFGRPFGRNPEAERRLRAFYPDPAMLNEARLSMADMPDGVELIDNPVSAAPGFRIDNVYVLAGVPKIMQAMVDVLKPGLQGGAPLASRTVVVLAGEGDIAAALGAIQNDYPGIDIGSYPFLRRGSFGTSVVFRGTDLAALEAAVARLETHAAANGLALGDADALGALTPM